MYWLQAIITSNLYSHAHFFALALGQIQVTFSDFLLAKVFFNSPLE